MALATLGRAWRGLLGRARAVFGRALHGFRGAALDFFGDGRRAMQKLSLSQSGLVVALPRRFLNGTFLSLDRCSMAVLSTVIAARLSPGMPGDHLWMHVPVFGMPACPGMTPAHSRYSIPRSWRNPPPRAWPRGSRSAASAGSRAPPWHCRLGDVDRDLVEEGIDVRPELGHRAHRRGEILLGHGRGGIRLRRVDRLRRAPVPRPAGSSLGSGAPV